MNSKELSQFTSELLKPDQKLESSSIVMMIHVTQLIHGCAESVHTENTASHPSPREASEKQKVEAFSQPENHLQALTHVK